MGDTKAETRPRTAAQAGRPPRLRELAAALASVAVGAGIVAAVPELRHSVSLSLHGDFGGLRTYIRGLDVGGLGLLMALMLSHAIIFYPTEIVTATAAHVYGFLPGLGFVMGGWLASALLAYLLGRVLGRPMLRAVLGPRFMRLERIVERGGTSLLISGRLVPVVPFSLMGYVAGAAHVRVRRFAWTTMVGFLPLTAAVAYLGSQARTLSVTDPVVWIAALLLVALFVAARLVNANRAQRAPIVPGEGSEHRLDAPKKPRERGAPSAPERTATSTDQQSTQGLFNLHAPVDALGASRSSKLAGLPSCHFSGCPVRPDPRALGTLSAWIPRRPSAKQCCL
jgi:uncharacterized membrane protein YdjX (TVP38/TMEM64 family)